ncbi:glycerophosphodiester phosphodiesterase family protein [Streptomyces sp. DSM 44915]|uniref:Glycerophosphodiester phosphodiesterase family protein n=1 Tax=Streptomyces chisholmiae TaxID=3075540 RepID=A0ABU2JK05_9ACTN|nr:glycerophosphodiester phosphodiesterase family protein [Streptomyces sp. DSM 44915]MDT0265086.1 glycerophosphodiester phosphodiesterase family protein [Streptomyces sp. DSM 44915]
MSNATPTWPGWLLGAITLTVVPVVSLPPLDFAPSSAAASTAEPAATTAGHGRGPLLVAHRGASGYAPENTLAAAEAAAETRTTWVETDVQRTADGELVLMHDTTLARTTNVEEVFPDRAPWRVADFTAAEIAQLDAGSWFGEEFAGEPVPTLTEFLDELAGNRQRLLLELKSPSLYPGIEADILDELGERGWLNEWYPGQRVVLQSFEADSVRTVHELAPRLETGFLGTPPVAEIPEYAEFADQINPRHADLTAEYVASIQAVRGPHGRPLKVYTWTVNDGELATRVAGLGVDGIISDVPDVVRAALR